ncbi:MAG: DAK2 domain-containing protein [Microbacterium gubbeenense]
MVTVDGWATAFLDRIESGHEELTRLDRLAGDGDFGDNLRSAATGARRAMSAGSGGFEALVTAFRATGGTSGPLFGLWFRAFARQVSDPVRVEDVDEAARRGLDAIVSAAGAAVGDNTMVDAMAPAVRSFGSSGGLDASLERAARDAAAGAESTREMLGRRGRSSYVGEHARGVVDPGALAVAWFFAAAVPA